MRQIVLDTETTGLDPSQGHKVIEIGCVELVNRKLTGNHLHLYINPLREIDAGALEVHGITNEYLNDKPVFEAIADVFLEFIRDAELVIHNAPFDIGFLNTELAQLKRGYQPLDELCPVIDTLALARKKHPGQKNNLDALCKRYDVDNSQRELHGALKDAEILADVYLLMTGGQSSLYLGYENTGEQNQTVAPEKLNLERPAIRVIRANDTELNAHRETLEKISHNYDKPSVWQTLEILDTDPFKA